jgi:hypothetical protein
MKNLYDSIRTIVLIVAVAILLAVSLMGCTDSIATDMETEHQRLSNEAKQELQMCPSAHLPVSQTEASYTAP